MCYNCVIFLLGRFWQYHGCPSCWVSLPWQSLVWSGTRSKNWQALCRLSFWPPASGAEPRAAWLCTPKVCWQGAVPPEHWLTCWGSTMSSLTVYDTPMLQSWGACVMRRLGESCRITGICVALLYRIVNCTAVGGSSVICVDIIPLFCCFDRWLS